MKKGYDFVRIVGIIIIILVLGFFGGYGIMQSQIDDQKEFKGVKNVIPMDNRTEQQIEQHDVKVEKSGIISKEQAEIIVLENADMEAKDISRLKTKIENYYGFENGISGEELYKKGIEQAKNLGINVKKENFEKFKKEFEEYVQNSHINDIIPIIKIDKEIDLRKINIQDIRDLKLLEPYGEANKMPLFLIKNMKIQSIRTLSEGKHIKLKLGIDNYIADAIGFNMGNIAEQYLIGDRVDVVGSLEINDFGDNENIQINLKDIRKTI